MQRTSILALASLATLCAGAASHAQAWKSDYETGITEAKRERWGSAREAFQRAVQKKPLDDTKPTGIPGPITERRFWRNGAPYSANLLAAYSGYRLAAKMEKEEDRTALLGTVAKELETLLDKKTAGSNAVFLLGEIYTALGQLDKRGELQQRAVNRDWREDTEIIAPEQVSITAGAGNAATNPPVNPSTNPPVNPPVNPAIKPTTPSATGPGQTTLGGVPLMETKFALVIGNANGQLPEMVLPHAVEDATLVKEQLTNYAGYPAANVSTLTNVSAAEIRTAANALAERMPAGATLTIFFAGVASNVNGRDYLAGIGALSIVDTNDMILKEDLYQIFFAKEARIFAFYECHRPSRDSRIFGGTDHPVDGQYAEMYSIYAGGRVPTTFRNGKRLAVFADAFSQTLQFYRTNQIPIGEFAWKLIDFFKTGASGTSGGSSKLAPTLPIANRLAADAKF